MLQFLLAIDIIHDFGDSQFRLQHSRLKRSLEHSFWMSTRLIKLYVTSRAGHVCYMFWS